MHDRDNQWDLPNTSGYSVTGYSRDYIDDPQASHNSHWYGTVEKKIMNNFRRRRIRRRQNTRLGLALFLEYSLVQIKSAKAKHVTTHVLSRSTVLSSASTSPDNCNTPPHEEAAETRA